MNFRTTIICSITISKMHVLLCPRERGETKFGDICQKQLLKETMACPDSEFIHNLSSSLRLMWSYL